MNGSRESESFWAAPGTEPLARPTRVSWELVAAWSCGLREPREGTHASALLPPPVSLNRAWRELVPQRPPTSLVSPQLLLSVLSQILLALGFQVGAFLLVQEQPWYCHKEVG